MSGALFLGAALALSGTDFIRMGKMAAEPAADGVITKEEMRHASNQYGLISETTGLFAKRYGIFYFGWTDRGFYFAARTSKPPRPQTFTADDAVSLELLPPSGGGLRRFTFRPADGTHNLPSGAIAAGRALSGITEWGVECVEAEMFIPYAAAGLPAPKDGEGWGLNMRCDFSSPSERTCWHLPEREGELGTFVPQSGSPVPGLVCFDYLEAWRPSGRYRIVFRFDNATGRDARLDSASAVHRGIGHSKLDSNPEKAEGVVHNKIDELSRAALPKGRVTDIRHAEWALWPGHVAILDADVSESGKPLFRRKIRWDIAKGLDWKFDGTRPSLDAAFYPTHGMRFRARYNVNKVKDLVSGELRVSGEGGATVLSRDFAGTPYLKGGLVDTNLAGLAHGRYIARFTARGADGMTYADERTFEYGSFPWQNANLGRERVIVPPFRPIRMHGDAIDFLQTGYRFGDGVFWRQVTADGEDIMAGPVDLRLNGEKFVVTAVRTLEAADDRVVRAVDAVCGDIRLEMRQTYDYDGFCLAELSFVPSRPVEVRNLAVEMPLKNGLAKLFNACIRSSDVRSKAAPDFTLKEGEGVVWSSMDDVGKWSIDNFGAKIQPYVWWGDAKRGFSWLMDSATHTSLAADRPAERIVRGGGAATLVAEYVNKPVVWKEPKTFKMGFQPSPVKPRNWTYFATAGKMWRYACPSNAIGLATQNGAVAEFMLHPMSSPVNTYPGGDRSLLHWVMASKKADKQAYLRELDRYVERNAAWFEEKGIFPAEEFKRRSAHCWFRMGLKHHTYYMDPRVVSCFWPEWETYKSEWSSYPWPVENFCHEYQGKPSPSRIDKLLYDARTALDDGYEGIYYDCFGCVREFNWVPNPERNRERPDGGAVLSLNDLLDWRELVRRTAVMCWTKGVTVAGTPYVEVHNTDCYVVPCLSFATVNLAWERGGSGGEYQDRFPESYMLADTVGVQAGTTPRLIVSTKYGDGERRMRELRTLMSVMCAYGIFSLDDADTAYAPWFAKAWNTVFDFGWGRPDVKPHWFYDGRPQPVKHDGADVRLTVAERADEALLMFGNLGEAATVAFDVSGLGFGDAAICDAETGEPLPKPEISITRRGYALVKVVRRAP